MKALRIHEHGGPSVLRWEDVPDPRPGPGQALVRVLAASINHLDLFVRQGMPGVKVPLPLVLGCDGTGEIVALGPSAASGKSSIAQGLNPFDARGASAQGASASPGALKVGQKVVIEPGTSSGTSAHDRAGNDHLSDDYTIRGEHHDGVDCELVAVETRYLFPLPSGLDPVTAAACPLVFLTAFGMVVTRARVQRGETVLVIGGASGVGSAAIQIAVDQGARVFATAGSEAKRNLALELGAEAALDHGRDDWGKQVKALTDGRGVDVVVEHVGPATWRQSTSALARNGRLVTCGGTTGPKVELLLPHLFIKNLSVLGSTMGPKSAYPYLFERLAAGRFRPVVDRVMPMAEARAAHELLEGRQVAGKIVLVPGS